MVGSVNVDRGLSAAPHSRAVCDSGILKNARLDMDESPKLTKNGVIFAVLLGSRSAIT